jgi:hypothetical protein
VVTYAANAQPIFKNHCGSCHGGTTPGTGQGNNSFASFYSDTQVAAYPAFCAGKTVGACTLVRIQNGSMPYGAGCTGNPTTDAGNAACLTAAEQNELMLWISDGQKP